MLDITDVKHLTKDIRNGPGPVIQLRFADIVEITAKDLRYKQDMNSLVAPFQPVSLAVGTHDAFHYVEVLLLLKGKEELQTQITVLKTKA